MNYVACMKVKITLCPVFREISKLFGINNSHNKTVCQL